MMKKILGWVLIVAAAVFFAPLLILLPAFISAPSTYLSAEVIGIFLFGLLFAYFGLRLVTKKSIIIVNKTVEEIKQTIRNNYPTKEIGNKFIVYHSKWISLRLQFVKLSQNEALVKTGCDIGCDIPPRTLIVFIFLFIFTLLLILIATAAVFWYYEKKFEKELAILIEYGE